VAVTPVASTAEKVDQAVYFVEKGDKRALLGWILEDARIDRALVFTRTKHSANRVAEFLDKRGIHSAAIHGNKSQNARERALDGFKRGSVRVLVATDIAARGIDIDQLGFVINYDLPNVPEAYVHRIGRTGRAGAAGQALSFCEEEERPYLADIERLIQINLEAVTKHPFPSPLGIPAKTDLDRRGGPQAPKGGFGARKSGGSQQGHRGGGGQPRQSDRRHNEASRSGERRPAEARSQQGQRPAAQQGQRPAAQQAPRPAAQQAQRPAAQSSQRPASQQAQRPAVARSSQGERRVQGQSNPQERERSSQGSRREETGRHETQRHEGRRQVDERARPVGSR
jgi:ATP-dependent RNA helicase RhlE